MNMREYQALAMRTSPRDGHDKIDNGILGLHGEAGEIVDLYKKFKYQSGPDAVLSVDRFADELGDVLWYLAELADGLETELLNISGADFEVLDAMAAEGGIPSLHTLAVELVKDAVLIENAVRIENAASINAVYVHIRTMLRHCAVMARLIGIPMAEIAQRNIEKLKRRYPDGFDPAISEARYSHE